jgi:hypothetical protein
MKSALVSCGGRCVESDCAVTLATVATVSDLVVRSSIDADSFHSGVAFAEAVAAAADPQYSM